MSTERMGCNTRSVQHESLKSANGDIFWYLFTNRNVNRCILQIHCETFLHWEIQYYYLQLLVFSNDSTYCVSPAGLSLHPHQHTLCVLSYDDTKSNWLITKHTGKMTTAFLSVMRRDKIKLPDCTFRGDTELRLVGD